MPPEKTINPAQAQRKAEKAKAIKKSKSEQASRRNEKLARRNPEHLQQQIDELEAVARNRSLTKHEKDVLGGLAKEVKAVRKARGARGYEVSRLEVKLGSGGSGWSSGGLGKRPREREKERGKGEVSSDDDDVPEDVRRIPMPRDTPPPIAPDILHRWYQKQRQRTAPIPGTNVNMIPLGTQSRAHPADQTPKVVYEAAPVLRDLRKEAVSLMPTAVRVMINKAKGVGGLLEPEEADRLERAGYLGKNPLGESDDVGSDTEGLNTQEPEESGVTFRERDGDHDG